MDFLTVIALLCIPFIWLGIQAEIADTSPEENDTRKFREILSDAFSSISTERFWIAFAVCFGISTIMMAYAGYGPTMQLNAISK